MVATKRYVCLQCKHTVGFTGPDNNAAPAWSSSKVHTYVNSTIKEISVYHKCKNN